MHAKGCLRNDECPAPRWAVSVVSVHLRAWLVAVMRGCWLDEREGGMNGWKKERERKEVDESKHSPLEKE